MVLIWSAFLICGAVILVAGTHLSREADAFADRSGLSHSFVGLLLLATVTSIPEMMTGISAAGFVGEPNLAVGNVLGACVLNLFVLGLLDIWYRGESVYAHASQGHILSAGFSVIMVGVVGFNIAIGDRALLPTIGHIGAVSPLLLFLYVASLMAIYRYEHRRAPAPEPAAHSVGPVDGGGIGRRFLTAAGVVLVAALVLPFIGDRLADVMGWQQTFVGTLFLAIVTTMPEMAVTIGALRLGKVDLAIAGLLGSNLFNMATICFADLAYAPGPLLVDASDMHAVSVASITIMSGIVISALLYRPSGNLFGMRGWVTPFLFLVFLLNVTALFLYPE